MVSISSDISHSRLNDENVIPFYRSCIVIRQIVFGILFITGAVVAGFYTSHIVAYSLASFSGISFLAAGIAHYFKKSIEDNPASISPKSRVDTSEVTQTNLHFDVDAEESTRVNLKEELETGAKQSSESHELDVDANDSERVRSEEGSEASATQSGAEAQWSESYELDVDIKESTGVSSEEQLEAPIDEETETDPLNRSGSELRLKFWQDVDTFKQNSEAIKRDLEIQRLRLDRFLQILNGTEAGEVIWREKIEQLNVRMLFIAELRKLNEKKIAFDRKFNN